MQTGANSVNVGVQQVPLAQAVTALNLSPLVVLDERACDPGILPWRSMMRFAFRAGEEHGARERERERERGRAGSGEEPGPGEGQSESEEQHTAPVQDNEALQPALGSPTGSPHVSTAQATLADRSADTPMTETMSSHELHQTAVASDSLPARDMALQQASSDTKGWDQLVADPFGLLMHLFASGLASQCSSGQQACPWDEMRDGASNPGDMATALQKPAALLQVHFYIQLRKSCLRLWSICTSTTSRSQISNQLMHSMPHVHVHCTPACHVNIQDHTSLNLDPAH